MLSSIVSSQVAIHAPYGGVVPEIAARAHVECVDAIIAEAMAEAGAGFADLDAVAATAGPGLVGGVMVGLSAGKAIALARGLPLIAVNHLEGHALSARLGAAIAYPFLLLLVSGGHCQLLDGGRGRRAAGGWARPSTTPPARPSTRSPRPSACPIPAARRWSSWRWAAIRRAIPCRARSGPRGRDFSFSGLKTAAARIAERLTTDDERRDLAAAVQAAIARQLADRSERAMAAYAATHGQAGLRFVVAGGVAANRAVRAVRCSDLAARPTASTSSPRRWPIAPTTPP